MPQPGSPYHRLALHVSHRWWRTLLGTLFIVVAGIVGMVVVEAVSGAVADLRGRPRGPLAELAVVFLSIAVFLPVIMLAARLFQKRPAGTLSSVAGRIRWRWLLTCLPVATAAIVLFLIAGTALSVATGAETGLGEPLVGRRAFLVSTAVLLPVVPFQAAAEEYLCRGWLLQGLGARLRGPWFPIAAQAVVFAALHGWGTPWGFADLVVFAVIAGWVTVRTGGIEAAVALHVMNNVLSAVLAAAFGQLTIEETAADMPWQLSLADAPVLIGFAVVILWLARRRGLRTVTPVHAHHDLVAAVRGSGRGPSLCTDIQLESISKGE